MTSLVDSDPVAAIGEKAAIGETAEIFADIRSTLDVEVVNLIWRHLATFPGALQWVWASLVVREEWDFSRRQGIWRRE